MKTPCIRTTRIGTGLSILLCSWACSKSAAPPPKTCCEQPTIPAGTPRFVVVADDVSGPSDGQKVLLRAGLAQPTKRDAIYPALHLLYRHAMQRGPFEPIHFVADVYRDEASARQGGEAGILARVTREQKDLAPKCDNRIPYDFAEQITRAFADSLGRLPDEDLNDTCHLDEKKQGARFDDNFTHKPSFKVDEASKSVEVTFPYLEDGKDEYMKKLKFTSALTYWIEFVTSMFGKVDALNEVAYVGLLDDQPVVKITVSRAEYNAKLSSLQETIAAHSAITFASLGLHKTDDKGAEKEQRAFHTKTYKEALAQLGKDKVSVSPKLK